MLSSLAFQMHRELIFGKWALDVSISTMSLMRTPKVLATDSAILPKSTILRCRVLYFTDGAILGSAEFLGGFAGAWQLERKHPPRVNVMYWG